ncbi:MAG: bifunctional D-glycero-beta-D-manno-heptose-7-phosphate kinase/D-glycero-beta-D-manno-heptose 1-phosphate adenylyltransferase HldE [Rikenellaceae bacterium]
MNSELNRVVGGRVLVIGDLMLDKYHIGEVKRISPEAPVPVVRVKHSYSVLGGGANVVRNLLGLKCNAIVMGMVGQDANGEQIKRMFDELGVESHLVVSKSSTITKTRIIGNNQQITRVDFEDSDIHISSENEDFILSKVETRIKDVDIVVISDYNKGLCSERICRGVIDIASRNDKAVVIDPKCNDWSRYQGATVITPNIKELSDIVGADLANNDKDILKAAQAVVSRYSLHSLLVTRSEKGMSYVTQREASHIPTAAREVFDVSGAGDTVVATLAACMSAGMGIMEAITIANKAAGVVVAKMGTSPITYHELRNELSHNFTHSKIIGFDRLPQLIEELREAQKRTVFTNGCFDILHKGHVTYMQKAKAMGDKLIVGLNSDASVKRLKGESRPINDEMARAEVLAALESIDYVVIFEDDTPLELIKVVCPDILVKGGDYKIEDIVGREYAKETATIPFVDGFSTTKTIERSKR